MIADLEISKVFPNPNQPRKDFPPEYIADLASSIREKGLLQAIRVTPRSNGYMIICGECRWRAHQHNNATTIRAEIVDASDEQVAIEAIAENLQRRNVTPLEEAFAYKRAMDEFGMTVEELARKLGICQPRRIAERIGLLNLRPEYQDLLRTGQLTPTRGLYMASLTPVNQDRLFSLIKSGRCETHAALSAATSTLLEVENQGEMFSLPKPTKEEQAKLTALERRVDAAAAILAQGFDDNEIVIAKKVDPGKAGQMADQLRLIQMHLAQLEKALRATAAQATLLDHAA